MSQKKLNQRITQTSYSKIKKRKVHSSFIDNILGADPADMEFNKEFRFLLCDIDIFSKCACVIPLNDETGITIIYGFQKDSK